MSGDDDGYKKASGQKLEILPESNVMKMRVGEEITLKILLDGKPLKSQVYATYDGFNRRSMTFVSAIEKFGRRHCLCESHKSGSLDGPRREAHGNQRQGFRPSIAQGIPRILRSVIKTVPCEPLREQTSVQESSNRTAIFSIVCSAHFINHFQSAMLGVIYPLMMKELGMTLLAIASLAAVYNTLGSVFQAAYGFVVPYVRRGVILGVGNCVLGLSVAAAGFASNFNHFFTARLIGGIGSSPQHPVGSSMLASHFGAARGRTLAFHSTAGQIGSLLAPLLAAVMVTYIGWRSVFWLVGSFATIIGIICFVFRDTLRSASSEQQKSRLTPVGWDAYKAFSQGQEYSARVAGLYGRGRRPRPRHQ